MRRSSSYKKSRTDDTSSMLSSMTASSAGALSHHSKSRKSHGSADQTIQGSSNRLCFRNSVLDEGDYEVNPYLLNFKNPDIELRYYNFQYTNGGFYGGKLWHLIAVVVLVAFLFLYSREGLFFTGGGAVFIDPPAIMMTISSIVTILIFGTLFYGPLRRYREELFVLSLMTHWPAFTIFVLHGKDPVRNTYGTPLICFFYCSFITFARFRRVIFFLSVTPLAIFFGVTYGVHDYWDSRSHYEMIYWFTMVPVIFLLHRIERRLRLCFAEVELSRESLTHVDAKSEIAQSMVINFFPPTITRDLLLEAHSPSQHVYTRALLVQTDLKAFTAWSSERGPNEVVDMLTAMTNIIEDWGTKCGIEKLTTVGDAYLGASFRSLNETPQLEEEAPGTIVDNQNQSFTDDDSKRCSTMLQFACAISGAAPELEMRIGVCMGTVSAGVIGAKPPKVDVFGDVVSEVARLEQTSRGGFVHVNEDVFQLAEKHGSTRGTVEIGPHGTLIQRWHNDVQIPAEEHLANRIRETLRSRTVDIMRNLDSVATSQIRRKQSFSSRASISIDGRSATEEEDDTTTLAGGMNVDEISSDNNGSMFHIILLRFHDEVIEEQFAEFVHEAGIIQTSQQLLNLLFMMLTMATVGTVCIHNTANRAAVLTIVADLGIFTAYLFFIGTKHRFNYPIVWCIYAIPVIMCSMLAASCEGYAGPAGYYPSVSWSCFYALWCVSPVFCVDIRMIVRVGVAVFTALFALVLVPVHNATIGHDDVYLDAGLVIACTCVSVLVAFFVDYTLRSSFAASIFIRKMMDEARRRQADHERRAIDAMLPPFVTSKLMYSAALQRRLLTATPGDAIEMEQEEDLEEEEQENSEAGGGVAAEDHRPVWDYPRAICLFLEFLREDDEGKLSIGMKTIDAAVRIAEDAFAACGVQKVKTIQNVVLAITGIEQGANPQHCALRAIQSTLDLMENMHARGISIRVGIHTGTCFGAVVGSTGLTFDVFGDSINTTSRLMTNTLPNTILASRPLVTLLGRHASRLDITQLEAMALKGKGTMEVFRIARRRAAGNGNAVGDTAVKPSGATTLVP